MGIPELFGRGAPVFSFEFFLPKTADDTAAFLDNVRKLKELDPSFVTLTYGAGGSRREETVEMAGRMRQELGLKTACHLTGIAHSRAEIDGLLDRISAKGIDAIVALRGDKPQDGRVKPVGERDFSYARDLVAHIRKRGGFDIAVAGYPETHPEAVSAQADLGHLAAKVAAGGDWVITQLFFDNKDYFAFVERSRAAGIKAPIVPGIMPVTGYAQLKRFTTICGTKIPARMLEDLEARALDPEAVVQYGIEHATRQCRELLDAKAPGIHFYTLNRSHSTASILANLRR